MEKKSDSDSDDVHGIRDLRSASKSSDDYEEGITSSRSHKSYSKDISEDDSLHQFYTSQSPRRIQSDAKDTTYISQSKSTEIERKLPPSTPNSIASNLFAKTFVKGFSMYERHCNGCLFINVMVV